ncbi:MAG: DJ-1/PfpI family protein [Spirochaetota bacterium]
MREIVTILFDDFETLDVFGPIEILGRLKEYFDPQFYSLAGGTITSSHKVPIVTRPISELQESSYILFIPGGIGTRKLVKDEAFIQVLSTLAGKAEFILTVCTGSGLFAKTGLLSGKRATSNKKAFAWVRSLQQDVNWVQKARWTVDGNIYTSAGVSAGMDMTLQFVADILGYNVAKQQSIEIEYDWKETPSWDPFADLYE